MFVCVCVCDEQPPIPTNKLGVEPKRPGLPVNITPQCHLSAAAPNHIHVTWTPEIGRVSHIAVTMLFCCTYSTKSAVCVLILFTVHVTT